MTELPLWAHQIEAVKRANHMAKAGRGFALFFEQGTGKSRTVLEILRHRCMDKMSQCRTLILCPVVVVPNWKNEIRKYTQIPESKVVILEGTGRQKFSQFQKAVSEDSESVVVTNYEAVTLNPGLQAEIIKWKPEVVILDESQRIKTHNSHRTKSVLAITKNTKFVYLLSGTPVLNSPSDLFSQFKAMDKGLTFGENYYAFRNRYFFDKNQFMPSHVKFPNWQLKGDAMSQINQATLSSSMRVTKEECLDLPPLVRQKVYCPMTPNQAKSYEEMRRDFISFINDKACVAQLALTKALRLQQIVSGFIKFEDGSETNFKDCPRINALRDLLTELTPHHKVIVWACFKQNYVVIRKLLEELEIEHVELTGETKEEERATAVRDFQDKRPVRVLLGNPGSGGIGVNLTASDYSIYYSRNFSLEADLQSEARNHRGGSERHNKITRIDLVTPETIDELVLEKLASKEEIGEALITEIREGRSLASIKRC